MEIRKLLNISVIGIEQTSDMTNLSLQELQSLKERCETRYKALCVEESFRRGLNIVSGTVGIFFPEGFKLGANRRLKFKDLQKNLMKTFLNPTDINGYGFNKILEAHNVKITQTTSLTISLIDILRQSIIIEKVEKKTDKPRVEEVSTEDEASEEELYEISDP